MKSVSLFLLFVFSFWAAGCGASSQDKMDAKSAPETQTPRRVDEGAVQNDASTPALDAGQVMEGIHYAFMPVHMEPGNSPVDPITGSINVDRPKLYFKDLFALVQAADLYGHKLTLMFTPQWAAYVVDEGCVVPPDQAPGPGVQYQGEEYSNCLSLIRAIEANGHELALHHHPLTAPSTWDGFTNETSWTADRDDEPGEEAYFADGSGPSGPDPYHLGDIEDLMAWLDQLPASGPGSIVTATTEEFPGSIRFLSSGGPQAYQSFDEPGDFVSRPCATNVGGRDLWQVRMRLFTSKSAQNMVLVEELPKAIADHEGREGPYAVGFVTHAKNVQQTGIEGYVALFEQLQSLGLTLERTQDVFGHYPMTAQDPAAAPQHARCP